MILPDPSRLPTTHYPLPTTICMCEKCRETIRECVLATFYEQRRWLGFWTIRCLGDLGWVPTRFYRSIIQEMCRSGILIRSYDPRYDDFPRYLSIRLTRRRRGGA